MNNYQEIISLEPKAVFKRFADILSIPHPSRHEEKIAAYLKKFANAHDFEAQIDEVGNVIMNIPANAGYEHKPRVILQAHMDMVPVAASGVQHDFLHDPIDAFVEDGWIKARGTTLGADDGLGESIILALLEDPMLKHGPLTAIFTVEEEVTMKGANNLKAKHLEGDYLINLDSEEDGSLVVGCAGSCDVSFTFSTERVTTEDTAAFNLSLSHFTGGHSGSDIHKGHANTVIMLCRMLSELTDDYEIFIEKLEGGQVRNAIPASCEAVVRVALQQAGAFKQAFTALSLKYKSLFQNTDPQGKIEITETKETGNTLSLEDSEILLRFISTVPNGVLRLWSEDTQIPETSSNLGLVRSFEDRIEIGCMPRSLKENGLDEAVAALKAAGELAGCELSLSSRHPCWNSPSKNDLIDALQSSYKQITFKEFKVMAIHAGLECAQFSKAAPHLQLISLGSTLLAPHSPDERAYIKGVGELYDTLRLTLSSI